MSLSQALSARIIDRTRQKPACLYLNLTNGCNSKCLFCASASQNVTLRRDIPLERILVAFDHYELGETDEIILNGGEPTTRSDLPAIIRHAAERHARIKLFTNGRRLRRYTYARDILTSGIFRLPIALYGRSARIHDTLTGEDWHQTRFEYDVVISFAGEDRAMASQFAARLRAKDVRVFYDRDEQADLLGKDLYTHLHEIYSARSRYCVVFVSESYVKKAWTTHERRAIQERTLKQPGTEYIIPIRLDDTTVPAFFETTGFVRIGEGIDHIIDLIIQKLWVTKEDEPKGYIDDKMY